MLRPGEQTCPGSDIKLPWAGRKLRTQVAYVHSQVVYVHSQVAFVHSQVAYEVYMRRKRSLSGGQGEFARQCAGITRHADAISTGCCWSSTRHWLAFGRVVSCFAPPAMRGAGGGQNSLVKWKRMCLKSFCAICST